MVATITLKTKEKAKETPKDTQRPARTKEGRDLRSHSSCGRKLSHPQSL